MTTNQKLLASINLNSTGEVWKEILNFPNYAISDHGRVLNLKKNGKIRKTHYTKRGYEFIHLSDLGKRMYYTLHKLVSLHFIPNPQNFDQVNHVDSDKKNNKASNLEWTNNSGNQIHAVLNGLRPNAVKLNSQQVMEIYNAFGTLKNIAKNYNISFQTVSLIKNGRRWNYVTNHI